MTSLSMKIAIYLAAYHAVHSYTTIPCHSDLRSKMILSMTSQSDKISSLSPNQLVSRGMNLFKEADIDGSIESFDRADELVKDGSLKPYLWQRGISYYYADRFQDGSNQFRYDVKVNPLDVEEIVWDIACQSRLNPQSVDKLSLPKGKSDRRKVMGIIYSLFRGDGASELDLAKFGHDGSIGEEFYALFYLGLYCESKGETEKASNYMKASVGTRYAQGPGASDYMVSVAKVHCKLRHW